MTNPNNELFRGNPSKWPYICIVWSPQKWVGQWPLPSEKRGKKKKTPGIQPIKLYCTTEINHFSPSFRRKSCSWMCLNLKSSKTLISLRTSSTGRKHRTSCKSWCAIFEDGTKFQHWHFTLPTNNDPAKMVVFQDSFPDRHLLMSCVGFGFLCRSWPLGKNMPPKTSKKNWG